ncbi:hypothetical protein Dsin_008503 [Dipteronia sinensis]|uniref:Reverse transcriptase domain-containing protein n=1 Tax=Dipteronia sinensis TaxID=43782 RepID=A0AAE0APA9_9ROSI|nr:hypothetical protein Dsin_008503 [Dipteronia sinensis]
MNVCLRCLNDGESLKVVNGTVVVLIRKVQNPKRITEFRPISLSNVIYKIVAKALANRRRLVLDEVISNSIESINRVPEWNFLVEMRRKLGFSKHWVAKMMNCISTVSFSFAINGDVCCFVKPSKGLCQGDPLSPYLFLICAEGLSSVINYAVKDASLSGF